MPETDIQAFKAAFNGEVFDPADAGYDQAHDLESAGGQLAGVTPVPLGQGTGRPAATLAPQPTPTP